MRLGEDSNEIKEIKSSPVGIMKIDKLSVKMIKWENFYFKVIQSSSRYDSKFCLFLT